MRHSGCVNNSHIFLLLSWPRRDSKSSKRLVHFQREIWLTHSQIKKYIDTLTKLLWLQYVNILPFYFPLWKLDLMNIYLEMGKKENLCSLNMKNKPRTIFPLKFYLPFAASIYESRVVISSYIYSTNTAEDLLYRYNSD